MRGLLVGNRRCAGLYQVPDLFEQGRLLEERDREIVRGRVECPLTAGRTVTTYVPKPLENPGCVPGPCAAHHQCRRNLIDTDRFRTQHQVPIDSPRARREAPRREQRRDLVDEPQLVIPQRAFHISKISDIRPWIAGQQEEYPTIKLPYQQYREYPIWTIRIEPQADFSGW
jgi:hypothetical protein